MSTSHAFMISAEDPEIIGSANRADGMGTLAIWSTRARDLIPHLTEQTMEPRGFQILCEAIWLWEQYEPKHPEHAGQLDRFFLLIEQAFGRVVFEQTDQWVLPGSRRVRARAGQVPEISLSDASLHLLGGQKANGLWGLYRGAAMRGGLIDDSTGLLSEPTRTACETNRFRYPKGVRKLLKRVASAMNGDTVQLDSHSSSHLVRYLTETFEYIPMRVHLAEVLVENPDLNHRLAKELRRRKRLSHRDFLVQQQRKLPVEHQQAVENVIRCENVLSVVESMFEWLCANRGLQVDSVATKLPLDPSRLVPALAEFTNSGLYGSGVAAERFKLYCAIETGSRAALARSVLELHRVISEARGRAPWVWDEDGIVRSDVDLDLPPDAAFEVGVHWRNDYYLRPLKSVATLLEEAVEP